MNAIFIFALLISGILLVINSPSDFILAMQTGATESLTLCVTLLAIYSVWLGVFEILEKTGLSAKLSRLLKKPLRFIFGDMGDAENPTSVNISANLLGLGGIATPMGIEAAKIYDKNNNNYAKTMLFVLAATSIQLLPVSVISLRTIHGAFNPSDIVLPTFLCTLLSTTVGISLVKVFIKR